MSQSQSHETKTTCLQSASVPSEILYTTWRNHSEVRFEKTLSAISTVPIRPIPMGFHHTGPVVSQQEHRCLGRFWERSTTTAELLNQCCLQRLVSVFANRLETYAESPKT